jgi:hypothetical protein
MLINNGTVLELVEMIHRIRQSHRSAKISWWQLDLLSGVFIAGLLGITFLHIPTGIEHLLEIGAVIIFYGLMLKWIRANAAALPDLKSEAQPPKWKR